MNQLEIGVGINPKRPGWITSDIYPGPNVDIVFDASQPDWPVRPNSFLQIEANHVIEHLPNFWGFFEGAWKSLREGGFVNLRLPYGGSADALADPTHLRTYYPASFCSLQPGYGESVYNPQHKWDFPFEMAYTIVRIRKEFRWFVARPWRTPFIKYVLPYLWDSCNEQIVCLAKMPRGVALKRPANMVMLRYGMLKSDYYNDPKAGTGLVVF